MKNKNIIGIDISLDVCRSEGYMMIDTRGNKKCDPKKQYRVFCHWPSHLEGVRGIRTSEFISWNELKEKYQQYKEALDNFSDDMPELMNTDEPTFYQMVSAASTIDGYCGLN